MPSSDKLRIAVHPDKAPLASGRVQSFSERWEKLSAATGHQVVIVDAYQNDLFTLLRGCDGFMWYFWNTPSNSAFGKRLMLAIHQGMRLPTFPSWRTGWFFEDKHAQRYLLEAAKIPIPQTWIFWNARRAQAFVDAASYPLVVKLSSGIVSRNVRLITDRREGHYLIARLFHDGIVQLPGSLPRYSVSQRIWDRLSNAARTLSGRRVRNHYGDGPIQRGSILFQEFLADNPFDTRVTVIGNRAFAFRRHNRPHDFRASGSGVIEWNPQLIDRRAVRLAFAAARRLRTQVLALDVLQKEGELVVGEITHYYEAWAVHECPGHWRLNEGSSELEWVTGQMHPADAIFHDFATSLQSIREDLGAKVTS